MNLTVVRHGETEGNVRHLVQSHTHGKLSSTGIRQAQELAEKLQGERFDIIYCSDLGRCIETAKIIVAHHEAANFIRTKQLRERSQGIYEGRHWEDLPGWGEPHNLSVGVRGGESWLDVERRISKFLNQLYKATADKHVLLITHGGPIKILRSLLENKPLQQAINEHIENGSIRHFEMTHPVKAESVQ